MRSNLTRNQIIAIFSPLLSAVFPIIALVSFNIQYVLLSLALRSFELSILSALATLLVLYALTKNLETASALTSFFVIMFFSYGHIISFFTTLTGSKLGNDVLSLLFIGALLAGLFYFQKIPESANKVNTFVMLVAVILIALNLYQIVKFELIQAQANANISGSTQSSSQFPVSHEGNYPDIYYIILDGHARSDVISEGFGYDNSGFLNQLRKLGFYVADCSQANYWQTQFSMGATFGMDYLSGELNEETILPDWQFTPVLEFLRSNGYTIITFETLPTHNQNLGEDILLSDRKERERESYEQLYPFVGLNIFEAELIKTTWLSAGLKVIANYSDLLPDTFIFDPDNQVYRRHYRQTLYAMDQLPFVPFLNQESPKFVYVHILSPHDPYIFDASGRYVYRDRDEYFFEGYRNNVEFLDERFDDILEGVIKNSKNPPIILIQGDHGVPGTEANWLVPILNAYYLPSKGKEDLYETISPINSFRIIFNNYFNNSYDLLEDKSFFPDGAGGLQEIQLECSSAQ